MKWNIKGREFDEIAKTIISGRKIYIWGAGVAGKNFLKNIGDKIKIEAFIDSNKDKIGTEFCGLLIESPAFLKKKNDCLVVIATLDFERSIEDFLITIKKEINKDFFYSNAFLSIYKLYYEKKLYMHHLNLQVTYNCTYKCKDCSLYIPFIKDDKELIYNDIIKNIDIYFNWVDFVQELHLIGGEPLLNKDLFRIIKHIRNKYYGKVGELAIATNGSIIPSEELIQVAKENNVLFIISDYSKSPVFNLKNKIPKLCEILKENNIDFRIGNKNIWFDFGNIMENKYCDIERLKKHFSDCFFRNRVMYNGKLYYCHHQIASVWADFSEDDSNNFFDLNHYSEFSKVELMEFDLGFNFLGYLSFCNKCNGYERLNNNYIFAAEQI